MDVEDEQIFELLCQNGRRSNREIARELGIPERQVAQRIRRMIADEDMRILAVTDIFAAGFEFMLLIGVEVALRSANEVAEDLAELPEVVSVMLTMGACDIEIVVIAENHGSLVGFVGELLSSVPGIRSFQLSLCLQICKYGTGAGPLVSRPNPPMRLPATGMADELDKATVECLWADPRSTNQAIASALGVSESAVRQRINAMRKRKLVRITAMKNMRIESGQMFASIGVEVAGRDIAAVAGDLASLPDTGFVATVLGRYHILVMGLLGSARALNELLARRIERIPGVQKVYTSQVLSFVKYDTRWTALMDEPSA
ncbi:MAG: Lrp/AsnC family transcriptional regulator [Gammaproteobacteria bacterium]